MLSFTLQSGQVDWSGLIVSLGAVSGSGGSDGGLSTLACPNGDVFVSKDGSIFFSCSGSLEAGSLISG